MLNYNKITYKSTNNEEEEEQQQQQQIREYSLQAMNRHGHRNQFLHAGNDTDRNLLPCTFKMMASTSSKTMESDATSILNSLLPQQNMSLQGTLEIKVMF